MAEAPISMNDILSDAPAPEPEPLVQVETRQPADQPAEQSEQVERPLSRKQAWQDKEQLAQGRVRDPATGQFAPKVDEAAPPAEPAAAPAKPVEAAKPVEQPAKPPQEELTPKEKAFLKAAHEERSKRQELERRLAEFEKAKAPAEAAKTFWDDPEAALGKMRSEMQEQTERVRAEARTQHLNTTEYMARKAHPDFDAKVEVFAELLKATPGLHQEWLSQSDPAEFAYATAKSHMELKEAGSVEQMRARIEKEVRLQVEAELKQKAEALEKERAALPPSLSDARSKGNNKTVWGGPPSMDAILKG